MTSVEGNIISYESGSNPYVHDKLRGKWASKWDFYFASFGHAFGLKNIAILPILFQYLGVSTLLISAISLILTSVPIYFLQSSLGQFSSTGFISVFRMSPMFKGIGYVILLLNITSVTYYTLFASYALTYFIRSLATELPWMTCGNWWNTLHCQSLNNETMGNAENFTNFVQPRAISRNNFAPTEYLLRNVFELDNYNDSENAISWSLLGSNLIVWICVFGCLFKGIESVSKASRYTISIAFVSFAILFVRFSFLPGALDGMRTYMIPRYTDILHPLYLIMAPALNLMCLGHGWGTVLTMASYNNFKTDVIKYSFIIPFGLFALTVMTALFVFCGYGYLIGNRFESIELLFGRELTIPFSIMPFIFGLIEASSLWSCIFYLMIFFFELNAITIQVFSVLTALFDEFISLRQYKLYVSLAACIVMFFGSIFFVTKFGYFQFRSLILAAAAHQIVICFFELMVVLWIYGRQRFQRDIKFMTGRAISTWQFFIMRFTTPVFCLVTLMVYLAASMSYILYSGGISIFLILFMKILPWFGVPVYIIYKLYTTIGTIFKRLQRCVQPTDWYPAEAADRHAYETNLGTSDNSHQLVEGAVFNEC